MASVPLSTEQLAAVKVIWDYMNVNHSVSKCDVIIVLGSHDQRVAERGAELFLEGMADWLVFSGGLGNLTKGVFERPEADLFADIARQMGVDDSKILVENRSTNTGENVRFSHDLLLQKSIPVRSAIAIQKPYMERRTLATFQAQWPDLTELCVTSPQLQMEEYPSEATGDLRHVACIMVGDLQRIKAYPALGFQSHQDVPSEVDSAWDYLVKEGFTDYMLKS